MAGHRKCKEQSTMAGIFRPRDVARGVTNTLAVGAPPACEISVMFILFFCTAQNCFIRNTSFFYKNSFFTKRKKIT